MGFVFGEVNIVCRDLQRSEQFYTDILGFKVSERERGCVHLSLGKQRFLLLPFAEEDKMKERYCLRPEVSFDLYTNDCAKAYTELKSHGVAIEKEPENDGEYFFIRDPDGNVIEVVPH